MKILVITEEDEFYLPLAIDHLLTQCGEQIVEVVCARNPLLPSKIEAARRFRGAFGVGPIISQLLRLIGAKMRDTFPWLNSTGRCFSVRRVCQRYGTPYRTSDNVNHDDFLQHCRDLGVELIVAVSPTQIFKASLIALPKHGCINIHTAKLPKYRGLYPTYWAMARGEKQIGISIHYIEQGIDTGKIILQDSVDIPPGTTLDHMLTVTKRKGAGLLVEAIRQIESGTSQPHYAQGEGSYFSFPDRDSYRQFKRLGYKLW